VKARRNSVASAKERRPKARRKISAAVWRKYRYLFGGKIPAGAREQIIREYGKVRNPGTGAFERCVKAVAARGSAYSPRGVCAAAGRKKYGSAGFQKLAAAGRRKAAAARSNPKPGRHPNTGRKRRSNPEEAAAERYRYFHGRDPETVRDVVTAIHKHGVLSGIGRLVSLKIAAVDGRNDVTLGFSPATSLAQNEGGTQLYITGGDQSVKLGDFGIKAPHEYEVLGAAKEVVYHTRKDHLVPEDGGEADYKHVFGKHGSRLPLVLYDVRNRLLYLAGGGYELPEVGIRG
jgi:hypothetical protein